MLVAVEENEVVSGNPLSKLCVRLGANVRAGLLAAAVVLPAAVVLGPDHTVPFYAAAVQVIPVFLVALAVEQTLARSLGTESAFVRERRERLRADFVPSPEHDVAVRAFEAAAAGRSTPRVGRMHDFTIPVSRETFDAYEDLASSDYSTQWQWLTAKIARVTGRVDDPQAEQTRARLAEERLPVIGALYLHDGVRIPFAPRMSGLQFAEPTEEEVEGPDLVGFIDLLHKKAVEAELDAALRDAARAATAEYRRIRAERRLSTVVSIALLAAAETAAFVGLLSPGSSYRGLFALSAMLLAASFVTVTGGALRELLDDVR